MTSTHDLNRLADLMNDSARITKVAAMCMRGHRLEQMAKAVEHIETAARELRSVAGAARPAYPTLAFGKR